MTVLLATGAQFSLAWIFWFLFFLWIILGFLWYWPRAGVVSLPWYGWGTHGMITLFIFLLGWGAFGLPGIGR
jgi:hypothetical protein